MKLRELPLTQISLAEKLRRIKGRGRNLQAPQCGNRLPAKKKKMDHSTPKEKPRANQEYRQALGQESPIETHSSNNHQLSPALMPEISVSSMECTPEQKGKTNLSAGTLALDIEHVRNRLGDSSLKY